MNNLKCLSVYFVLILALHFCGAYAADPGSSFDKWVKRTVNNADQLGLQTMSRNNGNDTIDQITSQTVEEGTPGIVYEISLDLKIGFEFYVYTGGNYLWLEVSRDGGSTWSAITDDLEIPVSVEIPPYANISTMEDIKLSVKKGDKVRIMLDETIHHATLCTTERVNYCDSCSSGTCNAPGDGDFDSEGFDMGWSDDAEGEMDGMISEEFEDGDFDYDPANLETSVAAGGEWIGNGDGALVQTYVNHNGDKRIVNREGLGGGNSGYTLKFYNEGISATKDGTLDGESVYTTTASPAITWKFENPNQGVNNTTLRVSQFIGASGTPAKKFDIQWQASSEIDSTFSGRKVTTYEGNTTLKKEALFKKFSSGNQVADIAVTWSANDTIVSRVDSNYTQIGNWTVVSNVTTGAGSGNARTTTYTYWDNSGSDGYKYGNLKLVTQPNGSWTYYADYDSQGRVLKRVEQFLSNAFNGGNLTANEAANRVFSYSYNVEVDDDIFQDSVTELLLGETIKKTYLRKAFYGYVNGDGMTVAEVPSGVAFDDEGVLKTRTLNYFETDEELGAKDEQPFIVIRPDQTASFYRYHTDEDDRITIVQTGSGVDYGLDDDHYWGYIAEGTQTTTITDQYGRLHSRTVVAVSGGNATNLTISDVLVIYTNEGKTRTYSYFNGTAGEYNEIEVYGCCGLESKTDRYGVTTSYTYDVAGRVEQMIQYAGGSSPVPEVVTSYVYNGTTTEISINGTLVSSTTTNTAGEATASMQGGRTTSFSSNLTFTDGGGVAYDKRVTSLPNGVSGLPATIEEWHYKDGSPYKRSGTGTRGAQFAYNITAGPGDTYYTTVNEVPLAANGTVVPDVYVLTGSDFAGRTVFVETPVIEEAEDPVVASYAYNELGQLERVERSGQPGVDYEYDGLGRQNLVEVDAANGAKTTTTSEYEEYSNTTVRKVTSRQYVGSETYIETISRTRVDGLGSWVVREGLWTNTTVAVDTGNKTVIATVTHPNDTQTITTAVNGRTVSTERLDTNDEIFSRTEYEYDDFGRLAESVDARNGNTTYTYDTAGRVLTVTSPDPGPDNYRMKTENTYTDLVAGAGTRVVTNITANTVVVATTTKDYYPSGELKSILGAEGYQTEYEYDYAGRVTVITTHPEAGAAQTAFVYSPAGLLVEKTDAGNNTVSYTYWQSGLMKSREWARGATTEYGYTEAGYLANITYSGNLTPNVTYAGHDRMGRPGNITDGSGTRNLTYNGTVLTGESYVSGLFSGMAVNRGLDAQRRVGNLTVSPGNTGLLYPTATYEYGLRGQLEYIFWGPHTIQFNLAENSSLVERVTVDDSFDNLIERDMTYDYLNRLKSVTNAPLNDGPVIYTYSYNDRGQRAQAEVHYDSDDDAERTDRWHYTYDSDGGGNTTKPGQVAAVSKNITTGNLTAIPGYSATYAYDGAGNRGNTTVNGANYTYHDGASASGNIGGSALNQYGSRSVARVVDTLGWANATATVTVSGLTVNNTLESERVGGYWFKQLPVGNNSAQIVNVNVTANIGGNFAYSDGQVFARAHPENFTYDDDGNLLSDGKWDYTWDGENRLVKAEISSAALSGGLPNGGSYNFTYDDRGRCVRKLVSGSASEDTLFVYDGWEMIVERYDAGYEDPVRKTYVWGLDVSGTRAGAGGVGGLIAMNVASGGDEYEVLYGYDANGNVVDLIDGTPEGPSGERIGTYEYDAFGNVLAASPDPDNGWLMGDNSFLFSTKYWPRMRQIDYMFYPLDLGAYYYGHRWYKPVDARWMSRDPIGEAGGVNLYAFCGNDGVNRVDLLGLVSSVYSVEDIIFLLKLKFPDWDVQGEELMRHWLEGTGNDFTRSYDQSWSAYMKENSSLKTFTKLELLLIARDMRAKKVQMKTQADGSSLYVFKRTLQAVLSHETGALLTGYYLLAGSNKDVGGYELFGHLKLKSDCTFEGDIKYTFNDKTDPNYQNSIDWMALPFKVLGARDFVTKISWHNKVEIKSVAGEEPGETSFDGQYWPFD